MKERKSLKNYLNAVRQAKINIHKFSLENKTKITQSLEFNKSIEQSIKDPIGKRSVKKTPENGFNYIAAELNNATTRTMSKSPYRAEMFRIKRIKPRKPTVPKSKVILNILSRNRTSETIKRLVKRTAKSTGRPMRIN